MLEQCGSGEGAAGPPPEEQLKFREYDIEEIAAATKGFAETEILGSGKFADVYRGTTADGVRHAFKKLKERAEEGSRAAELLERELRTLCRLSHPSVLRLHGSCLTHTEQVLVYEIVEGGTLQDVIKGEAGQGCRLHLKQRLAIAQGIAEALGYLHSQGVIHRDIKPANILLSSALEPKVADFGLLKCLDPDHSDTITRLAGTPGFMDPETMRTSRVSFQSDTYSFGIILLTLLTGRGPAVVDMSDISYAKQCEESAETGGAPPEELTLQQLERRRRRNTQGPSRHAVSCMALRRWVSALHRAGQMQAILDPFLWPLWEQSLSPPPGTGGTPTGQPRPLSASREDRRERMRSAKVRAGTGASAPGQAQEENEEGAGGERRGRGTGAGARGGKGKAKGEPQSPEEAAEERQRKTQRIIKALVALALHCSAEEPQSRPPSMATVAEDLKMMSRSVPPLLKPGGGVQELALADVLKLAPGCSSSSPPPAPSSGTPSLRLSQHPRAGEIFYGKSQWDGDTFVVQRVDLHPPLAPPTPGSTARASLAKLLLAARPKEDARRRSFEGGSESLKEGAKGDKQGVEMSRSVSEGGGKEGEDVLEAVVERARAASGAQHTSLLPVVACCRSPATDEAFVVYGVPRASQGYELLERVLLGTGAELLPVLAPSMDLHDFVGLGLSSSGSNDVPGAASSGAPGAGKGGGLRRSLPRMLSMPKAEDEKGDAQPNTPKLPSGRKLSGRKAGSAGAGDNGTATATSRRRNMFARLAHAASAEGSSATPGPADAAPLPLSAGGSGPVDFTPPPREGQALSLAVRCGLALEVAQALEFLRRRGTPAGAVALGSILVDAAGSATLLGHAWPGATTAGAPSEGERPPPRGQRQGPGGAAGAPQDVAALGEFILELVLERGPQVTAAMDLFAVEAGKQQSMALSEWVELLIDKGRLVSMAADIYPSLVVREERDARGGGAPGAHPGRPGKGAGSSRGSSKGVQPVVGPQGHALESLLSLGLQCMRPEVLGDDPFAEIIARLQAIKAGLKSGEQDKPSGAPAANRPALVRRPAKKR